MMDQNNLESWVQNQEQSVGDVQVQGDGNVFNILQGQDIQVVNLTVYDHIPEALEHLPTNVIKPLTKKDYGFRKVLLSKIKKYWVQDVLEKSLHTRVLIELGLEDWLDAVKDPFNYFSSIPEESKRTVLKDKSVLDVFRNMEAGRTLLILGEPGAGKTITLLKLAKDLIARCEQDLSQPVPVVLNLSSWTVKRQAIASWLVEELSSKYQVSKDLGKTWVAEQQLLLLLDGLDEVRADRREACVEALNQFLQDYGQTEMVVCSRVQDYKALSGRLQLQSAIYIQSLSVQQINQYLDRAGDQLQAVKLLLNRDVALRELATSPLMLSVMSLAYQNQSIETLPRANSVEESRRHLFDMYIRQMLRRRKGTGEPYSDKKMVHWLVNLAQRMVRESQTIFLIERMQPAWCEHKTQMQMYRVGLAAISGLMGGLVFGLTGGLSGGLSCESDGSLIWNSADALVWGSVLAIVGAIAGALIVGVGKADNIRTVETVELSLGLLFRNLTSRYTLTRGLVSALIGALGLGLCTWGTDLFVQGVMLGLSWGLIFGLMLGLSSGLTGSEVETKTVPNQGIWRSLINAGLTGLGFGMAIGLCAELGFVLMGISDTCKLLAVLLVALGFGGLGSLVSEAGKACLRHVTLRLVLFCQGFIPWNYAHFLDCAVESIFLQKVGGAYIFMHRTLMEHFSQMEPTRK
jgi:DNA polymerase III delta prime subunit